LAEAKRTIEDRLREEYFQLLPEIRRVAGQLEAQINADSIGENSKSDSPRLAKDLASAFHETPPAPVTIPEHLSQSRGNVTIEIHDRE
jgi:hypothetical protein